MMKTMSIYGVTVEYFEGGEFEAFLAEENRRREEIEWEEDTRRWLANPANWDSEIYSDVYKDLYGVRPHGRVVRMW